MANRYLLLHQTGVIASTDTLTTPQEISGLVAVINLATMEVCAGGGDEWEGIPEGFGSLLDADAILEEYDDEQQEEEDDDYEEMLTFPRGSRRLICPELLWKYCK